MGEAALASGGAGTATGVANTFVTYAAGAGLRPLNPADEFANNSITANKNTYVTAATAGGGSLSINSLVINGGDLSVGGSNNLSIASGALLFASTNRIVGGTLTFTPEAMVTVDAGVTATIASKIMALGSTSVDVTSFSKAGGGNLILSNPGNSMAPGKIVLNGGGTVTISGITNNQGQSGAQTSKFLVGNYSSNNIVNVPGRLLTATVRLGEGTFGGNSLNITGIGTDASPTLSGSGANLAWVVGGNSSNNSLTLFTGATLQTNRESGTNTFKIGESVGGTGNTVTISGAGARWFSSTVINVGYAGSNNFLTISDGGYARLQRLYIGGDTNVVASSNNAVLITDLGSEFSTDNTSNSWFQIGLAAGANNNSFTVANGGVARILGQSTSRVFDIGGYAGANNNYAKVTGAGSLIVVAVPVPLTFGGLDTGSPADTTASGNHLDVFGGATLNSTTLEFMGVNSAFNLGDGTGMSLATLGKSGSIYSPGVILRNADSRLNFNSGKLIAGVDGAMVSGLGQIVLNGPAVVSTGYAGSTISNVLSGSGSFTKEGSGTLTLTAANSSMGATIVNAGILSLDYSTTVESKLNDGSMLVLGGGTLNLTSGSHVEIIDSTTLHAGRSGVTVGSDTPGLRMNAISPGVGIVNFGAAGIASTSTPNDGSGILGGWATVGGSDWATRSATLEGGGNYLITAYTGYTDVAARAGIIANGPATNVRLNSDGTSGNINISAATTTVNTLLQNTAVPATVALASGNVLATNGIMIGSGKEALTIGAVAGNGSLRSATAGTHLVLDNLGAGGALTINAAIVANGNSGVATAGLVVLNGVNTYTGPTGVGGNLTIEGAGQLNSGNYAGDISMSYGASLTMGSSANQILGGVISGDGGFIKAGTGATTLAGANTYTGATTIHAGVLTAGNARAFGAATTASLVFGSDSTGTVRLNGNNLTLIALNTNATPGTPGIESGSATAGTDTLTLDAWRTVSGALNPSSFGGVLRDGSVRALALIKNGPAMLTLSGNNSYSGGTTVTGGTLTLANQNGLGSGPLALANGTIFQQTGFDGSSAGGALPNVITLTGDQITFNIPATQDIWLNRNVAGTGTMRLVSNVSGGVITLSGAKTFSGGIIQAGTGAYPSVAIDNIASLGSGMFRAQINSSSTNIGMLRTLADLSGGTGVANAFDIAAGARLVVDAPDANPLRLSGAITGGGNLAKTGTARLILSGANTYTGTTAIEGGSLSVTHAAGLSGTTGVTLADGTGLNYEASADAPLVINGALAVTGFSGVTLGGSIGATPTSASVVATGMASAASGSTLGVNVFGIPGVAPASGSYTLVGGASTSGAGPSTLDGATYILGTVYNASNFTVGALSATSNTLNVAVTAATPLATAYYQGDYQGGVNSLPAAPGVWAASDGSGASNWTRDAGGALATSLTPGAATNVIFSASGAVTQGAMTLGSHMAINSLTVNGSTAPAETNPLVLLANGGYTLTLGSAGNPGISVKAGAAAVTLDVNIKLGSAQSWSNNSGNLLGVGGSLANGGYLLTVAGTGNTTLGGSVGGSGGLTKTGAGTLVLAAANTYSGNTLVSGGTLKLNHDLALQNSVLDTSGGGSLNAASVNTPTMGGLLGNNNLALPANVSMLTLNTGTGVSAAYSGGLSGAGLMLTKTGAGTQSLSGANSYGGATHIYAGTLLVNGIHTGSGAVSVATGATLGGSGSIAGATTIQGIHAPGNSAGIQSFSNGLAYAAASHLQWQLTDNVDSGRGSNFDGVDVTGGTFAITGGAIIDLSFGAPVDFLNSFWDTDRSWLVVDLGSSLTGDGGSGVFTLGTISGGSPDGTFAVTRVADASGKKDVMLNWSAPAGNAYDLWIASKGLSGGAALPAADPDRDGVSNALEFVLGGEPNPANAGSNSRSLLPAVTRNAGGDLIFTFRRKDLSESAAALTFQWSADLAFPVANNVAVGGVSSATGGVGVVVNENSPDAATDTIVITVPAAKAVGGKLFGRLGAAVTSDVVPVGTAYEIWIAARGLTGPAALPYADPDQDGLANALEFVLGGEPNPANAGSNSSNLLPVVSQSGGNLTFSFRRKDLSEGASTVTFQWSTDLSFPPANDVAVGALSSTTDGVGVAVTENTPDADTDAIVISVPLAKAAGGKLFGRLRVTVP